MATASECGRLPEKNALEKQMFGMCVHLAKTVYQLPLKVKGTVLLFDGSKLTIFYEAAERVDFRALVREMFSVYHKRIWMQAFDPLLNSPPAAVFYNALITGERIHLG